MAGIINGFADGYPMPGPVCHVKAGPISVPIYWHEGRQAFRAQWGEGKDRREIQGKNLDKLRAKVRKEVRKLVRSDFDFDGLSPEQKAAVRFVVDKGLTVSDLEGLQTYEDITLDEAVSAYLESKRDRSTNHQATLRTHLRQLCKNLGDRTIASIQPAEIDTFLARGDVTGRTRRNKRNTLVGFWKWARSKGYLPETTLTAADKTDAPSAHAEKRSRTIETWSPAELAAILQAAPPEYLPWLCFSAFAGLRTFELFEDEKIGTGRKAVLNWTDVDTASGRIDVPAAVSKTADRRTIPISDNLAEWICAMPVRTGPVCAARPPWRRLKAWKGLSVLDKLSEAAGSPWKRNALRHSFGTYHVIQSGSVGRTALAMGNSEAMVRRNYLDVGRTEEEADAWFSLRPESVDRGLKVC